jgi:hypothetical protein
MQGSTVAYFKVPYLDLLAGTKDNDVKFVRIASFGGDLRHGSADKETVGNHYIVVYGLK